MEGASPSISLRASRRAVVVVGGLLALSAACSSNSTGVGGTCMHPCDLAQTARIEVSGGAPANVAVTDPCSGGGTCIEGGCAQIDVHLANTAATPADGSAGLVCHVTVTSTTGQTAEADLTAHYTAAPCCAGYEFDTTTVQLTFGADASAAAGPAAQ